MGVIGRPHGVRGLVRVTSYAEDLTAYGPLTDAKGRRFVLRWRGEGVAEVAELVGGAEVKVADRTAAEKLTNTRLFVDRAQLPEPEEDEFYLADLIGLAAVDARRRAARHGRRGARLRRRRKPGDRAGRRAAAAGAVHARLRAGGRYRGGPGRGRCPPKWWMRLPTVSRRSPSATGERAAADAHDLARLRADAVPGDVSRAARRIRWPAARCRPASGRCRPSTSATSPPTGTARWMTRRSAAAPAWCCGRTWSMPRSPRSPMTGRWCS